MCVYLTAIHILLLLISAYFSSRGLAWQLDITRGKLYIVAAISFELDAKLVCAVGRN